MAEIINGLNKIEQITLGESVFGNGLNERLEQIDDNFQSIITSEYLKGDSGTSFGYATFSNKSEFANPTDIYVNNTIPNPIRLIDIYSELCNVIGVTNIDEFSFTFIYEIINGKKIAKSSLPFVYYDPSIYGVSQDLEHGDRSCIVIYDNDEFKKLNAFPTIYYNEEDDNFCWKINGIETKLTATGPRGERGPAGGFNIVTIGDDYTENEKDNNIKDYIIEKFLYQDPSDNTYRLIDISDANEKDRQIAQDILTDGSPCIVLQKSTNTDNTSNTDEVPERFMAIGPVDLKGQQVDNNTIYYVSIWDELAINHGINASLLMEILSGINSNGLLKGLYVPTVDKQNNFLLHAQNDEGTKDTLTVSYVDNNFDECSSNKDPHINIKLNTRYCDNGNIYIEKGKTLNINASTYPTTNTSTALKINVPTTFSNTTNFISTTDGSKNMIHINDLGNIYLNRNGVDVSDLSTLDNFNIIFDSGTGKIHTKGLIVKHGDVVFNPNGSEVNIYDNVNKPGQTISLAEGQALSFNGGPGEGDNAYVNYDNTDVRFGRTSNVLIEKGKTLTIRNSNTGSEERGATASLNINVPTTVNNNITTTGAISAAGGKFSVGTDGATFNNAVTFSNGATFNKGGITFNPVSNNITIDGKTDISGQTVNLINNKALSFTSSDTTLATQPYINYDNVDVRFGNSSRIYIGNGKTLEIKSSSYPTTNTSTALKINVPTTFSNTTNFISTTDGSKNMIHINGNGNVYLNRDGISADTDPFKIALDSTGKIHTDDLYIKNGATFNNSTFLMKNKIADDSLIDMVFINKSGNIYLDNQESVNVSKNTYRLLLGGNGIIDAKGAISAADGKFKVGGSTGGITFNPGDTKLTIDGEDNKSGQTISLTGGQVLSFMKVKDSGTGKPYINYDDIDVRYGNTSAIYIGNGKTLNINASTYGNGTGTTSLKVNVPTTVSSTATFGSTATFDIRNDMFFKNDTTNMIMINENGNIYLNRNGVGIDNYKVALDSVGNIITDRMTAKDTITTNNLVVSGAITGSKAYQYKPIVTLSDNTWSGSSTNGVSGTISSCIINPGNHQIWDIILYNGLSGTSATTLDNAIKGRSLRASGRTDINWPIQGTDDITITDITLNGTYANSAAGTSHTIKIYVICDFDLYTMLNHILNISENKSISKLQYYYTSGFYCGSKTYKAYIGNKG